MGDAVSRAEKRAREAFAKHRSTLLWDHPDQNGRPHAVRAWRWGEPGTGVMASTIYVVPGRLIIAGDIADAVFERCTDMIGWALGSIGSPHYVLEKVPNAFQREEFSEDKAREFLKELKRGIIEEYGRNRESWPEHMRDAWERFPEWERAADTEWDWRDAAQDIHGCGIVDDFPSCTDVSNNLCWAYWVLATWLEAEKPAPLEPAETDVR